MIAPLLKLYIGLRLRRIRAKPRNALYQNADAIAYDLWMRATPMMRRVIETKYSDRSERRISHDMILDVDELLEHHYGLPRLFDQQTSNAKIAIERGREFVISQIDSPTMRVTAHTDEHISIKPAGLIPEAMLDAMIGRPVRDVIDLGDRYPSVSDAVIRTAEQKHIQADGDEHVIPRLDDRQMRQTVRLVQWIRYQHRVSVWGPSNWAPLMLLIGVITRTLIGTDTVEPLLAVTRMLGSILAGIAAGSILFDIMLMTTVLSYHQRMSATIGLRETIRQMRERSSALRNPS